MASFVETIKLNYDIYNLKHVMLEDCFSHTKVKISWKEKFKELFEIEVLGYMNQDGWVFIRSNMIVLESTMRISILFMNEIGQRTHNRDCLRTILKEYGMDWDEIYEKVHQKSENMFQMMNLMFK